MCVFYQFIGEKIKFSDSRPAGLTGGSMLMEKYGGKFCYQSDMRIAVFFEGSMSTVT